jgi:hypothetical protein
MVTSERVRPVVFRGTSRVVDKRGLQAMWYGMPYLGSSGRDEHRPARDMCG